MTIRGDILIDWNISPRIVEVAAPSTELTIQDLYDTLRSLSVDAIDEPEIIDGSGKESLGAGVLVGLTTKLLNARVRFEDRTGPSWVVCSIRGGNLVAVDEAGDPISPIEPSAYTQVQVVMSAAGTITITGSGVTEQDKTDITGMVGVLLTAEHEETRGSLDEIKHSGGAYEPEKESLEAIRGKLDEMTSQDIKAIKDAVDSLVAGVGARPKGSFKV